MGYRNTDLELRSRARLDALVAALGDRVLVLRNDRARGVTIVRLDVNGSGLDRTPSRGIGRWITLLSTLRGEPRRLLRGSRGVASIGVDEESDVTTVAISPDDVRALARFGLAIEVVVYAPARER